MTRSHGRKGLQPAVAAGQLDGDVERLLGGELHSQWNIPVALLGGGGGTLKGGRHIAYKEGTPFSNLHVAMLNKMGIETESFGGELGISDGELDLDRSA